MARGPAVGRLHSRMPVIIRSHEGSGDKYAARRGALDKM